MATKRKWPPFKVRFVFTLEGPVAGQVFFFPRVFPLSDQSGKLKGSLQVKSTGRSSDFPRSIFCKTEICVPSAETLPPSALTN